MLNSKKIVVLLVVIFLIIGICTQVRASNILDLEDILNSNGIYANQVAANQIAANELSGGSTANQILANQIKANQIEANEEAGGSVIQPNTNRTSNSTTSGNNLPQTGVTEDITVMFFIIVCVIVAIYAYKKIRDYKS